MRATAARPRRHCGWWPEMIWAKRKRVRRVWAAVSATPHASRRELMARLDMSYGAISAALDALEDAGYIETVPGAARARRIVVPFIVKELK
jgi:DNA-binding transcriptional ArsR family regulator